SEGLGKPGTLEGWLETQEKRQAGTQAGWPSGSSGEDVFQPQHAGNRRLLRTVHVRLRKPADRARTADGARGPANFSGLRQDHGKGRMGAELGGNSRR